MALHNASRCMIQIWRQKRGPVQLIQRFRDFITDVSQHRTRRLNIEKTHITERKIRLEDSGKCEEGQKYSEFGEFL